ncbi:hypothetical protein P3X46_035147 [Hevea brasiliensis]|uniref:RING-type domain-containing protein n=1 Tax=Hevea brasiliensis TaxID=3981 RepID=A0ABQ9KAU8_HEVBR|nr:hypothetical protein P3X46_035147 [Hevea brasiliensis]
MDQDEAKSNENHSSSSRDSNPCPICLGPFLQESYLDSCLHKFCYSCILHWTKVVAGKHSHAPCSVKCPLCKLGILSNIVNALRYWKSRKYLQPNRWLQSWLRIEIQALLQEEDVEIIVHHMLGVVDSFLRRGDQSHPMRTPEKKQGEFKNLVSDAARTFLAARTERFVNEMELFLASGFNIEAYDEAADVEHSEHTPIVPYLYIFYDDSDETD